MSLPFGPIDSSLTSIALGFVDVHGPKALEFGASMRPANGAHACLRAMDRSSAELPELQHAERRSCMSVVPS